LWITRIHLVVSRVTGVLIVIVGISRSVLTIVLEVIPAVFGILPHITITIDLRPHNLIATKTIIIVIRVLLVPGVVPVVVTIITVIIPIILTAVGIVLTVVITIVLILTVPVILVHPVIVIGVALGLTRGSAVSVPSVVHRVLVRIAVNPCISCGSHSTIRTIRTLR
jgi:hypothetical protein